MSDVLAETLSANLKRLMGEKPELSTQASVGKRAGVDQRTIGRILNMEHAPRLDQLEAVARAFSVSPWQLLHPAGAKGIESTLSPEAADIARRLDRLKSIDPSRRERMIAFCALAAIADPPTDPDQNEAWVEDMVRLLRASLQPTAHH